MRSILRTQCTKLKIKLRRPRKEPPEQQSTVRTLSPEPLLLLYREKALSIIFEHDLQHGPDNLKPTFLLLPYEIRRQIVEYCVCGIALQLNVAGRGCRITQPIYFNGITDVKSKRFILSIPLTCRQLYVSPFCSINTSHYTECYLAI